MPSIRAVRGFTYKDALYADFDQIGSETRLAEGKPSSGIKFARKFPGHTLKMDRGTDKAEARTRVVELFRDLPFHSARTPTILTMPGLHWKFERQLVAARSYHFHSVEKDPAIFRASIAHMIGIRHVDGLRVIGTNGIASRWVNEYRNQTVESFVAETNDVFDGAWLDFTGFLTEAKLRCLCNLWKRVKYALVITSMEARWGRGITAKISKFGCLEQLMAHELNQPVHNVLRYAEGAPMHQVSFCRHRWKEDDTK